MKYIDADRLKAEIEREIHEISHPLKDGYEVQSIGKIEGLSELLEIIDSLQQEQLDIDKIKREWYNKGYLEGRKNAHVPARELGLPKSCDFQKEQSEVDLEKEYKEYVEDDPVFSKLTNRNVGLAIAKHFFNLGLNVRKEGK